MATFRDATQLSDAIVERTLRQLRDVKDDEQEQVLRGTVDFRPTVFQTSTPEQMRFAKRKDVEKRYPTNKNFIVLGPHKFRKRFAGAPQLAFGQQASQIPDGSLPLPVVGTPTSYQPFIVQPIRWQWTYVNGEVDGFYVGLYAMTRPPRGVTTHTIDWIAVGSASRYSEQGQKERWTSAYDFNEAPFLEG